MKIIYPISTLLCIMGMTIGCSEKIIPEAADLVLLHGKILTMDEIHSQAADLAVKGNLIIAVGNDNEIKPYIGSHTEVIDLKGRLAVPGLINGHGHFISLGESLMGFALKHTRTWKEIVHLVSGTIQKANPDEWIVGRGWHQDKWEEAPHPSVEGLPIHQGLSEVSAKIL